MAEKKKTPLHGRPKTVGAATPTSIRLTPEVHRALQEIAKRRRLSVAALIRRVLEDFVLKDANRQRAMRSTDPETKEEAITEIMQERIEIEIARALERHRQGKD